MHGSILGLTKDIFRGEYPSNLNPWLFSMNSARLFVVLIWIIVSALFRPLRGVYFILSRTVGDISHITIEAEADNVAVLVSPKPIPNCRSRILFVQTFQFAPYLNSVPIYLQRGRQSLVS